MAATNLQVRQEYVQRIYNQYSSGKFIVNRRYQRKLVWDKSDKQGLIDTLTKGYPIPLFLLAKGRYSGAECYEIIDGMQRLNAIFSYIEQEYDFNGCYFDLRTMVESQSRLDSGALTQKLPMLDRDDCEKIATYTLAISEFSADRDEYVDEVFRRINSNGKYLSPQEVRSAGVVSSFAQLVRVISSKIRGDVTTTDLFPLSQMPSISLTEGESGGVRIDKTFWVRNGVYVKQQIKESRDEEIIADIIAFILLNSNARSAAEVLDDYYGIHRYEAGASRKKELEEELVKYNPDVLMERFLSVHDLLDSILSSNDAIFSSLVMKGGASKTPRYYQCVFLAIYDLMVNKDKELSNVDLFLKNLNGISAKIPVTTGGKWNGKERSEGVKVVGALIENAFIQKTGSDPATFNWLGQLKNLLGQSRLEQPCYDFKQGFINLTSGGEFDEGCFDSVLATIAALANLGQKSIGYILIGVADKKSTADRHASLSGMEKKEFEGFYITGVDYEAVKISGGLDKYQHYIVQRIRNSNLELEVVTQILNDIRYVSVYGRHCFVIKVKDIGRATHYGNKFFIREGANTVEAVGGKIISIISRFN